MAESEEIVLYDIPSQPPCSTWSPNTWKARFVLNFKGLPYATQWVEYPDIKPTLEPHVPPHEPGAAAAAYTSPTIRLPDGTYIMDSLAIASKLEGLHPTPSLHLDSPYLQKLKSTMDKLNVALAGAYIPLVAPRLLNEASHPYWYKTREARFGMPLDRVAKTKGGDAAYQAAKPYLDEVTDMLKEDASGPYFMGQTVSYADFVWGGFLIFMKRIGEDIFSKVMEACHTKNVHEDLLKALEPLNARNDR